MFQVIYENSESWPETGPLLVEAPPISLKISISPDSARQRANGYLVTYVSMTLHASEPRLIVGDRTVWRLSIDMRLLGLGHVATLGSIDVDAQTRTIIPLSDKQIRAIRDQANAIITRLTPETTAAV